MYWLSESLIPVSAFFVTVTRLEEIIKHQKLLQRFTVDLDTKYGAERQIFV